METKDAMKAVINASTARTENTFANTDLIQLYDNNGNPSFKISKSDFMSAVYNYLTSSSVAANLASVLGAASQGTITPSGYDSADKFGMYVVNGTSTANAVSDWGRLFVIPQSTAHALQVKYSANTKKIIIRYKYKTGSMTSAEWTAWSEVNVTALT